MKENQRIENLNEIKQCLENQGYSAEKCTISVLKANVMAFVTAGPVAILCCLLFFYKTPVGTVNFSIPTLVLFYVLMLAFIFIHEFLHGLTWRMFCKNKWESIHIGVMWSKLTPFCCCMEPLNFWQYIIGGLMPFIVLGLGLFIISLITGNVFFLWLSFFNILAAGGDTTIALMLINHKNDIIIDHPTECGFWAFKKTSTSKK